MGVTVVIVVLAVLMPLQQASGQTTDQSEEDATMQAVEFVESELGISEQQSAGEAPEQPSGETATLTVPWPCQQSTRERLVCVREAGATQLDELQANLTKLQGTVAHQDAKIADLTARLQRLEQGNNKPASCSEAKSINPKAGDGEYTLYPFSTNKDVSLRVYCHGMASGNPKEFLSLPSGPDENYATVFSDRLVDESHWQCTGPLQDPYASRAGTTKFSKLRIQFDASRVEVIRDDYTFAQTTGPNDVDYGHAGDCYSANQECAKGTFRVNLTGTELALAPEVHWVMEERFPESLTINDMFISEDRKVASARCGGWCGHCWPAGKKMYLTKEVTYPQGEVNLALGKTATQSSDYDLSGEVLGAGKAVDGSRATDIVPGKACTHTQRDYQPWWKVDLSRTYTVHRVTILNRGDCCGERLKNFAVRVGPDEDFSLNGQCGETYTDTPTDGQTIVVYCNPLISGRYVSVQLMGREDYLSLCEVEVYAETGDDDVRPSEVDEDLDFSNETGEWLALDSSWVVGYTGGGVAARALDGDDATFWNPHGVERYLNNWYIALDLTAPATLTRIAIDQYGDTRHDIAAFKLQTSQVGSPYDWKDVASFTNVQGGTDGRQEFGGFQGTARYWRFLVTETHKGFQPWLRELNFYGVPPASSWSASSQFDSRHSADRADINSRETSDKAGAWAAVTNDQDQWLMRDLGEVKVVTGVITKGRDYSPDWPHEPHDQYVTSYVISYGVENGDQKFYTNAEDEITVFAGNSDRDGEVHHDFGNYSGPDTLMARFVKIHPRTWHQHISMRAKIITSVCPSGYVPLRDGDRCFNFSIGQRNYTDARSACQAAGGHLAMPRDHATNDFLVNQIRGRYPNGSDVWFGLTDQADEGSFVWEDGTPLTGWSDWCTEQPGDYETGEDCVEWWGERCDLKWNDVPCTVSRYYVCEAGAIAPGP
ncbi:uncharacterized protein LOC144884986 isoform X2 [Branchiostoma floridae x Branchiostoma japonicum]